MVGPEGPWDPDVVVKSLEKEGILVTPESLAQLESLETENPCASLGWLARLFLFGLDFGIFSLGITDIGFAGAEEAGVAAEVFADLQAHFAQGDLDMPPEEIAMELRLLGVHACEKRNRIEICGCLAEFTKEELHAQITVRSMSARRRNTP